MPAELGPTHGETVRTTRGPRYTFIGTHVPEVILKAEPDADPAKVLASTTRRIRELARHGKEFYKRKIRIEALERQQEDQRRPMRELAANTGFRGLVDARGDVIIAYSVTSQQFGGYDSHLLQESLGTQTYRQVVGETATLTVTGLNQLPTTDGLPVTPSDLRGVIDVYLGSRGVTPEQRIASITDETRIKVDEEKLRQLEEEGSIHLLPGARTIRTVFAVGAKHLDRLPQIDVPFVRRRKSRKPQPQQSESPPATL